MIAYLAYPEASTPYSYSILFIIFILASISFAYQSIYKSIYSHSYSCKSIKIKK